MQSNKFSGRALLASLALSLSFVFTPTSEAATVNSFDDIEFWTGTGSNESALVIQFNDGNNPVSLAWGFRWDDANTTVQTMLLALAGSISGGPSPIAGSDLRLGMTVVPFSELGYYVDGVTYDQVGLSGVDQVTRSQQGFDPVDETYWAFYIGSVGTSFNGTFTSADFGISTTLLSNNGWFGLSYSTGPETYNFAVPEAAAVPEPSTILLLVIAGGFVVLRMHRNARSKNSILAS